MMDDACNKVAMPAHHNVALIWLQLIAIFLDRKAEEKEDTYIADQGALEAAMLCNSSVN